MKEFLCANARDALKRMFKYPSLVQLVNTAASGIKWLVSPFILHKIVRLITGMPDEPAWVTVGFLKSPMGVKQALYASSFTSYDSSG